MRLVAMWWFTQDSVKCSNPCTAYLDLPFFSGGQDFVKRADIARLFKDDSYKNPMSEAQIKDRIRAVLRDAKRPIIDFRTCRMLRKARNRYHGKVPGYDMKGDYEKKPDP